MTFGGWCGHKYPQVEACLLESVNEKRVARGMQPLVKSVWGFDVTKVGPHDT